MVGIGQAMHRQQLADQCAEAPLHAVAHHGIADALGDGDAETQPRAFIGPGEQHETGTRDAQAPVGGEEIGTPRKDGGL